jgi:hypothetical protein
MTTLERVLSKAIYNAIKEKAKNLNFVDKMVLMNALNNDLPFEKVPAAQQKLFLSVGMEALKALQAANGQATG